MANATEEKPITRNSTTFTVEIDTKRNGDILLQSIEGCRLRGALDPSKVTIASTQQKTGHFEPTIPLDQTSNLGQLPKVPGQRITVNTKELSYEISDPLRTDENMKNRLLAALKSRGHGTVKIDGVPTRSGTLTVDRMKTLCRELMWLINDGDAKSVDDNFPTEKDIDALKGDYLLNPGQRTPNMQPQYEKEFPDWIQRLARSGG